MPYSYIFLIVLLFFVIAFNRVFKRANYYFELAGKILNTRPEKSPLGMVIKGNYKSREVIFRWILLAKAGPLEFRMRHRGTPRKSGFLLLDYPRPTAQTSLVGEYVIPSLPLHIMSGLYCEQDFINILDELTRAAEIVESSAPFYRG